MAEKQTEKNPASVDDQGFINPDYYITAANDIIKRYAEERGFDLSHITTNQVNACYLQVYRILFRPEGNYRNCNVPYNQTNIERLINIYISLCALYSALPSVDALEWFTGINEATFDSYLVTPLNSVIRKARKTYLQNRLNDSVVGVIALANNDADSGLCYTRQNYIAAEAVKKSLSFEDLKQIAQRRVDDQ